MAFPRQKFNSLNVWVAAKKEKRTHSATLTKNAPTFDSSKMTSFDFFNKQIAVKKKITNIQSLSRFETAQTVDFSYCIVDHYSQLLRVC